MKNMKKSILGIAIIAIILMSVMVGSVNAASLTVNNNEIKKGEIVTVSINTEKASQSVEFAVKYDASKFEYVDGSASTTLGTPTVNAGTKGIVKLVVTDPQKTTNQVTLQFKALETVDTATFSASDFYTENTEETLKNTNVTVKVIEETSETPEEPTKPEEKPTKPEETTKTETNDNQSTTNKQQTNANEKIGTNGQVIKKLPQTGAPVFIGAIALIVVSGVVLVARRNTK